IGRSSGGIKVLDETGTGYVSRVANDELSNSDMQLIESGGIDSWNFTLGANYNHNLYVGFGIGLQSILYEKSSSYIEDFSTTKGIELRNALTTSGSGINFKAGVIYRPVPELRLGFSYNTGTYYMMTDVFSASMASWGFKDPITDLVYSTNQTHIDNEQYVDYMLKAPWQMTLSAAYQFEKRGLFSFDMDYVDNSSMNLKDDNGYEYSDINSRMNTHFSKSLNFRIGGEMRLNDNFSARLGAAYYGSPLVPNLEDKYIDTPNTRPDYSMVKSTMYASMGVGYRSGAFFTDVALQERVSNEHFFNYYDDISLAGEPKYATLTRNKTSFVVTAGVKF
ncbi:MAG: hypothetical protein NTY32_03910, partial [Bacteroidia bacterium]|nr:hypothetical protein [Bacteroidia bacterium]